MMKAVTETVSKFQKDGDQNDPRDLRRIKDGELLDALLRRDNRAWTELMRRFDPLLRMVVRRRLARSMRTVLASDAVNDVMGAFYLDLVEADLRKLRIWGNGPRIAKLSTWLTMIAGQIAVEHVRGAFSRHRVPRQLREENRDADPNRGGTWIGELLNAGENESPKRKRRTKTVEDELRELRAQHAEVPVA